MPLSSRPNVESPLTVMSLLPTENSARGALKAATALTLMSRLPMKNDSSVGEAFWKATRTALAGPVAAGV
ncbi:hypothetical protein D3C87_1608690 [compost metagenome]